ncbi:hypothetical protein HDU93_008140 [Gonapodya sp. JEL0774]|nr:hypothetical protein HDU93_008140 [Gonapodya sp. JEL0774]
MADTLNLHFPTSAMAETQKWMFKWNPPLGTPLKQFSDAARSTITELLKTIGPGEHILYLTEDPPPRFSLVPYVNKPMALFSVKGTHLQLMKAKDIVGDLPGTVEGWSVEESVPVMRKRTWGVGEKAPGVTLVTLFRRNPRLDDEAFTKEWYEQHTPLSLKIHPLAGYVRNKVNALTVPDSKEWHGIVTECVEEKKDLLNYTRMFAGPKWNQNAWMTLPNMIKVGLHIYSFLDFWTIENYFVEEYLLQEDLAQGKL